MRSCYFCLGQFNFQYSRGKSVKVTPLVVTSHPSLTSLSPTSRGCLLPSQVPRPSCVEGRENEGPITGEFSFHGRLWQKFSLKVENSAHNWNLPHVNSLLFIDEPGISALGAAVQLLFSLPPVWAFPSPHLGIPISAFFNWISFVFVPLFVFLFSD